MARLFVGLDQELRKRLLKSFQSGNINFLLGSGASDPAIPVAGSIETEIADLLQQDDSTSATEKMCNFLSSIQEPTNDLIKNAANPHNDQVLSQYEIFLKTIEEILLARRTVLLPRQATIFTTNYDVFIEKASSACPSVVLNDGFTRSPSLRCRMEYSSRSFFRSTYNTGNLYDYKVEVPCINLIKLHGSLSWAKDAENIILHYEQVQRVAADSTEVQRKEYIDKYAVILPQAAKFRTTLLDSTYYDLLRIYANSLDRENTVLIAFGFSFGDEHIKDITTRALKNPTLRMMIYAFNDESANKYATLFNAYGNVEIIAPGDGQTINFERFNASLRQVLNNN